MRIVDARLEPRSLRLRSPLVTARARHASRDGYVVRLRALDARGHLFEGQGEATPFEELGTESHAHAGELLTRAARRLVGTAVPQHAPEVDALVDRLVGAADAVPASRFGVEVALLDVLAQRDGLPLARLLSPSARRQVPVSALLGSVSPEALADEAATAVEEGFSTVKVKVGAGPLDLDVRRLAAVRERVGATLRVRADANGAWTLEEARRALGELAQFDLEFCEQPVRPEALEDLARLADEVAVPIAADESVPLLLRGDRARESRADVWVLKPMVLGGLRRTLEHATRAASLGVDCVVSTALDGPVARAAQAHLAAAVPRSELAAGLAVGQLFAEEAATALHPRRGTITIPDAPGLGLDGGEPAAAERGAP